MRNVILASVLLLAASAMTAHAQVTTPHPRLMLDANTLASLRARAAANTPQWLQLKDYCDSLIGGTVELPDGNAYPDAPDIGQGYQGSDYLNAVLGEALCYQALVASDPTSAAQYGDKARDVLFAMSTPYNNGAGHGQDPCTDDGYGTRFFGVGMGIGYDWVYDRLSAPDKTQIYTTANAWLASFADLNGCSGFEYANPQGNYFAGYFHAAASIALATFGDNPNAPALWTDWLNDQFMTASSNPPHIGVQPYYAEHLTGGGWPEGFGNYGPLGTLNMSLPTWEVSTAVGTDLIHAPASYTFPIDQADYLMYFTWPSLVYFDDRDTDHSNGDSSAPPPGSTNAALFMQELAILRYWNAPHADVFQAYTNAVNAVTSGYGAYGPWEAFMFYDPNGSTQPIDTLPTAYFATGMNAVSARSDWTTGATWMSFRAAPYINNPGAGEEQFDQGSIALVRGGTPLLVNGSGWIVHEPGGNDDENRLYTDTYGNADGSIYSGNRTIDNIFYVRKMNGNTVTDRYGQGAYTAEDDGVQTSVAAFEDGGGYVYALATKLEQMYEPDGNGDAQVAAWAREVVYLRPSRFVIYDRTTEGAASDDQFLAFHFPAQPTAGSAPAGETRLDVTYNAIYAGAMTTVLPADSTTATIGMYPPNDGDPGSNPIKVWQVQVRPPDTNVSQKWLTVFDLSASSAAVATANPVAVTAGAVVGVRLSAADGNNIVLSNSGAAGSTISGTIQYSTPALATRHLIAELPPNSGYTISVVVSAGNHNITVSPTGPYASSAKGILTFTLAADGTVGPGDRIFADGFGG